MHEIDRMLQLQLEGRHDEARALSDKLEAIGRDRILDPQGKNSHDIWMRHCFNRGWFIIQDGDYQKGCQLLENGRFLNVYGSPPLRTDAPIYNPSEHDIKGKSIIISLEGGYGDEIIHARFAASYKKLGAAKVYLAAALELHSVFSRIKGVDKVILRTEAHTVPHDYWVPGFSSGWIAGHTFAMNDFPDDTYMYPNPEISQVWSTIINANAEVAGKKKVGIRWAGNPKFEHQQFRKFPEKFMTNLAKYPELQIYSLQRDHNLVELPENVIDLQHLLISWEDTMSAIDNLDLVITSCTSIAHISAAMGKETWVVTPVLPYHTWTYGSPSNKTSPYYKIVRLFRQQKKTSWNAPFQEIYAALEEKYNLAHIDQPNEDRVVKRLNLGSGFHRFEGFVNVDINPKFEPDVVADLNQFPWPFEDNEFDHIIAKDILEHLGNTPDDFIKVIKELYRISHSGATWEIQAPHWNCDIALDDPTHVRQLTPGTFRIFNKRLAIENLNKGDDSTSLLSYQHDIDIETLDSQYEFTDPWQKRITENKVTNEELTFAINHYTNVILSVKYLIQVHKPGRIDNSEFEQFFKKRLAEPKRVLDNVPTEIPPSIHDIMLGTNRELKTDNNAKPKFDWGADWKSEPGNGSDSNSGSNNVVQIK